MNILIVDDNKNNRMILRLLLEDYVEDNNEEEFFMDEAEDGLVAVRMCEKKKYDMLFMDIMMPNMDGIEATKLIRQSDKKVMIIAVSAVEDNERQKHILGSGAEDYISKPVNADIFTTRVANYISLIQSRNQAHANINEDGINFFTNKIYNRYTKFSLSSEDALSELWECFLLDVQYKYDNLSDVIRTVFSLGETLMKLEIKSNLYVEESEEYQYFSVVNLEDVPQKIIELTLKKNGIEDNYKLDKKKISFQLEKVITPVDNVVVEEKSSTDDIDTATIDYSSVPLTVFDYIEHEDMMDLEEYASKLGSLMLIVGSGDVSEEEFMEMYTYIEKLGTILSTYSEVYKIAQSLSSLAVDMQTHADVFFQNSEALGPMCTAFSRDFTNWIEQSFHTGAPSVDFMNDTIAVNCETIGNMLKIDETPAGDDFDDIFDF